MTLNTLQNHCGSKKTMSDSMGEDGVDGRSESMGEASRMEYGEKRERVLARHASYTRCQYLKDSYSR
jgi:hypothetical protein